MATLAPINTPSRQPFGLLNDSKLRQLQSIKNRQNAITPSSAPSLKRRAASPETSDSENVDPNLLDLFGKRKRSSFEADVSLSKPSRFSLNTISKPRSFQSIATPRLDTVQKSTTPVSAPPAAGRSPTNTKRHSLAHPKKRFAPPPSFGLKSPALSVSAALSGTITNKKARKVRTIQDSKPKSWFFDIFEEPEQVQNDRMNEWTLSQSAACMDVSDDESKAKEEHDRGKENIDPNEMSAPVTRSAAAAKAAAEDLKKDLMIDDRNPLGDLNPVDFYAEGLDATSVVLVQDDVVAEKEVEAAVDQGLAALPVESADFTFESSALPHVQLDLSTEDISAVIMSSVPSWEALAETSSSREIQPDEAPLSLSENIDIWESESAKDDSEKPEEKSNSAEVFALQEL